MGDAGALLVRAGLIRPEALEVARQARDEAGGTLAEQLVLAGAVDDEALTQFFRQRLLVPRISDTKLASLPETVVAKLGADMAAEHRAIPVAVDRDGNLTVAMSDPSDTHAVDEIGFFTEHYVVRAVASQRQIAWGLANYYNVMTPLAEAMLTEERAADAEPAPDEPTKRRPRSLSIQVAAARHEVVAPATRPPLDAPRPNSAIGETARSPGANGDAPFVASLPDHLRAALFEGARPSDEASISGVISAAATAPSNGGAAEADEPTIEVSEQAIELDADYADGDDDELETLAPLDDGSPPELAPRAGELLVGRTKQPSVGSGTPAVVLDETLMTDPAATAPEIPEPIPDEQPTEPHIAEAVEIDAEMPGDDEDSDEIDAEDLAAIERERAAEAETEDEDDDEADAPRPRRERGTDSAPILLSELIQREHRDTQPPPGLVTAPAAPADSADDVVLLETPKQRSKRSTQVGLGLAPATIEPVASPRADSDPASDPAAVLLDGLENLQQALDRDAVVAALLDYFEIYCSRVAFFALRNDVLTPWQSRGGDTADDGGAEPSLSLDELSTLGDVIEARLPYRGAIADTASRELIAGVFGASAGAGLAVPVAVRGRVVGLLYAEGIDKTLSSDNVALIVRAAGRALERVVRRKPTS